MQDWRHTTCIADVAIGISYYSTEHGCTFVFVLLPMFKLQIYTVSSLQLRRANSVAAVKQEGEPEPYLLGQPPERRPDYRNQLRN